ncbi:MAG: CU044_2847 family protein [Cyanobacteria bacterium J06656_5]
MAPVCAASSITCSSSSRVIITRSSQYLWLFWQTWLGYGEKLIFPSKFGIKIAGLTGLPFFSQGSAEGSFEIEVKCKPK